jgi:hypothetical protein
MPYTYTVGAMGSSGSILTSNGANGTSWNTTINTTGNIGASFHTPSGQLILEGENADVKINGVSLSKTLEGINKRLAILEPNMEKLEHFAALKKAYEHYKTLEALCEVPPKENEN